MAADWFLDQTIVAFDTETTGAYPVAWEVCEIGAVKWKGGKVVDRFTSLVKPKGGMNPVAQKIHGISLNDLMDKREAPEVLKEFTEFVGDSLMVAHHAPFDLGFLSWELERAGISLLNNLVFCTSLLSRRIFSKAPNHKLQTLVDYLDIEKLEAHRAYDDAKMCLDVFLKCIESSNKNNWESLARLMQKDLTWKSYSLETIRDSERHGAILRALEEGRQVKFIYQRGSKPNTERFTMPMGIVRSPDGDFFMAKDKDSPQLKRFYLEFVTSSADA